MNSQNESLIINRHMSYIQQRDYFKENMNELDKSSITTWTTNDVEQWLRTLNFSNLIERFCQQNGIDGLTLLLMKEEDLKQPPLSIERLCDIKKLWHHIRLLQCQHNEFYSTFSYEKISSELSQTKSLFKTLKGEKFKTFVSFLYALISGIWTSFVMVLVHNRVPNVQK